MWLINPLSLQWRTLAFPLSQKLPFEHCFLARGGVLYPLYLCILGFCRIWTCVNFVFTFTVSMNSHTHTHQSVVFGKCWFPVIIHFLWPMQPFCFPFCINSWFLMGEIWQRNPIPFGAECFEVFHFLHVVQLLVSALLSSTAKRCFYDETEGCIKLCVLQYIIMSHFIPIFILQNNNRNCA